MKIGGLESCQYVYHPIYKEIAQSKIETVKIEQHVVALYSKYDCCFKPRG
jgi:hypothetical protein